jgi:hypothetical protein
VPPANAGESPAPRPARVHRADRVRDWIALGLVLLGALVYGVAHRGMGLVARDRTPTTAEAAARGEWKMVRWNRYERMSRTGVILVASGALVAAWSFARHATRRRRVANAP